MIKSLSSAICSAWIVAALFSGTNAMATSAAASASATSTSASCTVARTLSEQQKISALIDAIRQLKGASFIRNGEDHSAIDAADHLAMKVKRAGNKVKTATQFIDRVASQSSITGQAYQIRMADGKLVNAGDFLRAELAKLK